MEFAGQVRTTGHNTPGAVSGSSLVLAVQPACTLQDIEHALDVGLVLVAQEARTGRPGFIDFRLGRVSKNAPVRDAVDQGLRGTLLD